MDKYKPFLMIKHFFWTIIASLFGLAAAFLLSLGGSWLWAEALGNNELVIINARPSALVNQLAAVAPMALLPAIPPVPLTLSFVGDIMLDRGVRRSVEKNGAGDWAWLFQSVSHLKDSDILFGNLEGPISVRGENVGSQYSFRFDPAVAEALATAGFDVLSVANNHAGDWSRVAFSDTLDYLNRVGIIAVGGGLNEAEASAVKIIERDGQKIGFLAASDVGPAWLAATPEQSGILLANNPNLADLISLAASQVDPLVVSFHFGDEYQPTPSARQQALAHLAIEAGAKIVVGHHPHVAQAIEYYQDGVIAYSLGNFIFDQYFSPETMRGTVLRVKLLGNQVGAVETETVTLNENYQPQL